MSASFSATFCAASPLIPVSISSKITVLMVSPKTSTVLMASITLEISPPEAILESGWTSSPKFVRIKNSTSFLPFILKVSKSSIATSNLA